MLSFLNKLISSHLHVLIEQVATENLLSVLVVQSIRAPEKKTKSALSHKLVVFVVEEGIVIEQEQELYLKCLAYHR